MVRDEAGRMVRLVANLLLLAWGADARAIDRRRVELDVLLLALAMHQPRRQGQPVLRFAASYRNQSGWRSAVLGINSRDSGPGDAVAEPLSRCGRRRHANLVCPTAVCEARGTPR